MGCFGVFDSTQYARASELWRCRCAQRLFLVAEVHIGPSGGGTLQYRVEVGSTFYGSLLFGVARDSFSAGRPIWGWRAPFGGVTRGTHASLTLHEPAIQGGGGGAACTATVPGALSRGLCTHLGISGNACAHRAPLGTYPSSCLPPGYPAETQWESVPRGVDTYGARYLGR